jgi:hypothetical protein
VLDSENAFNSLSPRKAYEAVKTDAPELRYYVCHVLKNASKVAFHTGEMCLVHEMRRGVMQGSPISGLLFNLAQADAMKRVRNLNPENLIVSLHDDHFIVGPQIRLLLQREM